MTNGAPATLMVERGPGATGSAAREVQLTELPIAKADRPVPTALADQAAVGLEKPPAA